MRRTTICRSSRAVLLALVAGLLGVPGLGAQDTTRAADTSQAPAAPAGQLPESHVVTRGETLWSISQLYFSDPLLWPEIYRLNTTVVRSEEHTSELQSRLHLVCRLLLEKKKNI